MGGIGSQDWSFRTQLIDPNGEFVENSLQQTKIPWNLKCSTPERDGTVCMSLHLNKVMAWNHETPHLYRVYCRKPRRRNGRGNVLLLRLSQHLHHE